MNVGLKPLVRVRKKSESEKPLDKNESRQSEINHQLRKLKQQISKLEKELKELALNK